MKCGRILYTSFLVFSRNVFCAKFLEERFLVIKMAGLKTFGQRAKGRRGIFVNSAGFCKQTPDGLDVRKCGMEYGGFLQYFLSEGGMSYV